MGDVPCRRGCGYCHLYPGPLMKKFNVWGPLVLCGAALLFAIYALFFEKSYLTYPELPFPIEAEKLTGGAAIPIKIFRCSSASVEKQYLVTHTLKNIVTEKTYALKDSKVSLSPGCSLKISMINVVPVGTPPGRYQLYGIAEPEGFIRKFPVTWYTEVFEVIP